MKTFATLSVLALASSAFATGSTPVAGGGLIISEVVDATLSGGNPKFVELTNTGLTDYTFPTGGGIIVQSNSNNDLNVDVPLDGLTIASGDTIVIQSSSNDGIAVFESTYGFAADLYTNAFFSNGDDRYAIWDGSAIVDIHGQLDTDGTGTDWEYLDGYAYSLKDRFAPNGGAFDSSNWFHSGVNALETGDDVEEAALIVALTTPGTHVWTPTPGAIALFGAAGLAGIRRRRA